MKAGRLLGIPVRLNALFLLTLVLHGLVGAVDQALAFLAAVALHELAHAVVARGYGVAVGEVELMPFGAVAQLKGTPEPEGEGAVAMAGPGHNLLLGSACWLLAVVLPGEFRLLAGFARINILLGVFNLIPVLPLDGGRLLRSMLARKLGFHPATARLAGAGRILAAVLGLGGLALAPFRPEAVSLVLLALFLYPAADRAWAEGSYAARGDLVRRCERLVRQGVFPADELAVPGGTPIGALLDHFRPGSYHLVLVLGVDGTLRGRLPETEVLAGLVRHGPGAAVGRLVRGEEALPTGGPVPPLTIR